MLFLVCVCAEERKKREREIYPVRINLPSLWRKAKLSVAWRDSDTDAYRQRADTFGTWALYKYSSTEKRRVNRVRHQIRKGKENGF